MLALVAYQIGKKLEWDAKTVKATNCPEADRYIRRQCRPGWVLTGWSIRFCQWRIKRAGQPNVALPFVHTSVLTVQMRHRWDGHLLKD